jgi:tetratricopeptide (TPR) repeat protein
MSALDAFWRKDYDKAISDYTEVIRLDPNDPFHYAARARAYDARAYDVRALTIRIDNKIDRLNAINDYGDAIRLRPNYAEWYYHRGVDYRYLGENAEAQADFDKAKHLGYTGLQ